MFDKPLPEFYAVIYQHTATKQFVLHSRWTDHARALEVQQIIEYEVGFPARLNYPDAITKKTYLA